MPQPPPPSMAHSCKTLQVISHPQHRPIRSFVRREGRLTPAQDRALSELLPRFQIQPGKEQLEFAAIFGNNNPVVIEIGFGNGTLLAEQAAAHPQFNFVGIEVHRPGVGRLLQQLDQQAISNVRVMSEDAAEILANRVSAGSLLAIWLFFPDPWPKKRHHKRRIMNKHFLDIAASALQTGGVIHMATDWQDYAQQMQDVIMAHAKFTSPAPSTPSAYPFARPTTHFERRGLRKGHTITDLYATIRPINAD